MLIYYTIHTVFTMVFVPTRFQIFLVFILLLASITKQEIFTSIDRLRLAMLYSGNLLGLFGKYNGQTNVPNISRFSELLTERYIVIAANVDYVAGNPLEVYRFVRLFAEHWQSVLEEFKNVARTNDTEEILILNRFLPGKPDLIGVIDGFARLQGMYNISAEEIANGSMAGFPTGKMTVFECFELGKSMSENGYKRLGVEWFSTAWKLLHDGGQQSREHCPSDRCDVKLSYDIKKALHGCQKQLQKEREISKNEQQILKDLSFMTKAHSEEDQMFLTKSLLNSSIKFTGKEIYRNLEDYETYENLCREGSLTATHLGDLPYSCYLTTNENNPQLLLRPAKLEILSYYPHIYKYHDILLESEIAYIKNVSYSNLETTEVDIAGRKNTDMAGRVSNGACVDEDNEVMKRINKRLEAATGLYTRVGYAVDLQVANYGIAGQYVPHVDSFDLGTKPIGENRLATMLFYLSDVKAGGATVFLHPKLKIPAQKGSAVFWFNFDADLNPDHDTVHAGCPVIIGSKWIANKWIFIRYQDLQCVVS